MNLLSHSQEVGEVVTQIIHFVGGIKRTYTGVIPSTIKQGQFTKFRKTDGSMVMINDANVLCIEIFVEGENENNNTDR
tara:strand:+ start:517 stop:750 length:234 start_codon:yes stop_codon:yes gene_type:complete